MRPVRTAISLWIGAFVRLGRPTFLVGGFVFYGLGAVIGVHRSRSIDWKLFAWGLAAVTAIQLMTHYGNDYFDLEADRANRTPTRWSGGSRVLPNGELPPRVALVAAIVLAALAAMLTLWLRAAVATESAASLLLFGALALAWAYSAPPLRLHSRGLGELDTAVVMTLLMPLAGFCLQARTIELLAVLALVPLCCLQFAMLLAVEFPDEAGDAAVGKRTLVVRWGAPRARRLFVASLVLAYLFVPVSIGLGLPKAAGLALLVFSPMAAFLARDATGPADAARDARVAFGATALLVASAAAELVAFARLVP